MKYLLHLFVICFILTSCSALKPKPKEAKKTAHKPVAQTSIETKQIASEEESNLVTEVKFEKQKAQLGDAGRKSISALDKKSRSRGQVKKIKVLTWGDMEYPSKEKQELSPEEKKLVKNRNEVLENYLKDLEPKAKIETYSMAERPGELEKMFSTEEAQIKKHAREAGIQTTQDKGKSPGKASKSIVIYVMDEK